MVLMQLPDSVCGCREVYHINSLGQQSVSPVAGNCFPQLSGRDVQLFNLRLGEQGFPKQPYDFKRIAALSYFASKIESRGPGRAHPELE